MKKNMKNLTLVNLIDLIRAAQRIALLLHVSPDGDTCGSALALRRALVFLGKDVTVVCDHKVPDIYVELEGATEVIRPEMLNGMAFDLAIAVDAADRLRLGCGVSVFDAAKATALIDHHQTNDGYAVVNYLRSPLSATGVLVMEVIDALGVPLDLSMATCLFVAISTDTGNFKQQNTDPDALRIAARCVEAGASPSEITRRVFDLKPLAQMKLIALALQSLETYCDGQISMIQLRRADFEAAGALPEHTEGIVNYGINTEGVQIACLCSQKGAMVKGSFRAMPPHDVSRVAAALGGGGHQLAAGCSVDMPFDMACQRMREEMIKELERIK